MMINMKTRIDALPVEAFSIGSIVSMLLSLLLHHAADLSFCIMASLFGRIRGGNMIYWLCMLWADMWFSLIFIWVKRIYEAPHDKRKSIHFCQQSYFLS